MNLLGFEWRMRERLSRRCVRLLSGSPGGTMRSSTCTICTASQGTDSPANARSICHGVEPPLRRKPIVPAIDGGTSFYGDNRRSLASDEIGRFEHLGIHLESGLWSVTSGKDNAECRVRLISCAGPLRAGGWERSRATIVSGHHQRFSNRTVSCEHSRGPIFDCASRQTGRRIDRLPSGPRCSAP